MYDKKVKFEGRYRYFFYYGRKYPHHKKKPSFMASTPVLGGVDFNVGIAQEVARFQEVNMKLVHHAEVNFKTGADAIIKAMEKEKDRTIQSQQDS